MTARLGKRFGKCGSVRNALEICRDDARTIVARESSDVVGKRDRHFVAAAHERTDAEAGLKDDRHGRRGHAARLAYDRDGPCRKGLDLVQCCRECRSNGHGRVNVAHTIWPAECETGLAAGLFEFFLECDAFRATGFGKSSGIGYAKQRACDRAIAHSLCKPFSRYGHDCKIGDGRQRCNRIEGRQPRDRLLRPVDRPDRARKFEPQQTTNRVGSKISWLVRCANDDDRTWCKQAGDVGGRQIVRFHGWILQRPRAASASIEAPGSGTRNTRSNR